MYTSQGITALTLGVDVDLLTTVQKIGIIQNRRQFFFLFWTYAPAWCEAVLCYCVCCNFRWDWKLRSWSFLAIKDSTDGQEIGQNTRIKTHFLIWIIMMVGKILHKIYFCQNLPVWQNWNIAWKCSVLTKLLQNPAWFPASLSAWLLGSLLARLPWN